MMKIKQYMFFAILIATCPIYAQTVDEMKNQIASIKKNTSQYLYAEAVSTTPEDAQALADEILYKEINDWVATKKKLQSGNMVVNNKQDIQIQLSLPRGNMFRSFIYVKKSDIIPVTNAEIIEIEQPLQASVTAIYPEPIEELKPLTNYYEMANKVKELKTKGKIRHYARYENLDNPDVCYLIVYNKSEKVVAILTPGTDRVNVNTGKADKVANYSGCGAIGIILNEK